MFKLITTTVHWHRGTTTNNFNLMSYTLWLQQGACVPIQQKKQQFKTFYILHLNYSSPYVMLVMCKLGKSSPCFTSECSTCIAVALRACFSTNRKENKNHRTHTPHQRGVANANMYSKAGQPKPWAGTFWLVACVNRLSEAWKLLYWIEETKVSLRRVQPLIKRSQITQSCQHC